MHAAPTAACSSQQTLAPAAFAKAAAPVSASSLPPDLHSNQSNTANANLIAPPHADAVWKWEVDDGSTFNNFDPSISAILENALSCQQRNVEVAEKSWWFDLMKMTQTNYRTQSTRRIQRLSTHADHSVAALAVAPSSFLSSAAMPHHSNTEAVSALPSASAVAPVGAALPTLTSLQPEVQQSSIPLEASQSHAKSPDFDAALGKLAEAATAIPFDIVYKVCVRKGHDVDAAKVVLLQIKDLHDLLLQKCSFFEIETAMVTCSDSRDAAFGLLQELLPVVPEVEAADKVDAAAAPAPETAHPIVQEVEKATCVICMDNPPTHAFIPCGHMHICGVCNGDKAIADGLHGKCPSCMTKFTTIVHIFPS
jgi:hypothetical protein